MTWRTGRKNGEGVGWTPEQIRRQATRRTNYERGIIATATVTALEGGNRDKKVYLRLTYFNSAVGYVVWFNGMMAKAVTVETERVTLTHLDTFRGNTKKLAVTITRREWEKFTNKAEKTEAGSVARALACVDLLVVKDHDLENGNLVAVPVSKPEPLPLPPMPTPPANLRGNVGGGEYDVNTSAHPRRVVIAGVC